MKINIVYNVPAVFITLLITILIVVVMAAIIRRRAIRINKLENGINEHKTLLKNLENEKEWLIQEINHRVKNNLQIVTSLLSNQVAYLKSQEALQAISISQHRLYTISLAYQRLYKNENLSAISIPHYIKDLVYYLQDELQADSQIQFDVQTDDAALPVTLAVPLGLIINEAVSNAIKYAFPQQADGKINIQFLAPGNNNFRLIIADNGIGLPPGFELDDGKTFGTSLIAGLSKQLGGSLKLKNEKGVTFTVDFSNLKPASRFGNNTEIST